MAAALDDLRERGYSEAMVWSLRGQRPRKPFYEAQGFTRDGAERSRSAWAHIPEVRYRRSLEAAAWRPPASTSRHRMRRRLCARSAGRAARRPSHRPVGGPTGSRRTRWSRRWARETGSGSTRRSAGRRASSERGRIRRARAVAGRSMPTRSGIGSPISSCAGAAAVTAQRLVRPDRRHRLALRPLLTLARAEGGR